MPGVLAAPAVPLSPRPGAVVGRLADVSAAVTSCDSGMPIARMRQFADLMRANGTEADRAALLEEHDREIDAKVDRLRTEQRRVREKILWYRSTHP